MKALIFLLFCLQAFARKYSCNFGALYPHGKQNPNPNDKPDEVSSNHVLGRSLTTISRDPIRITLDTTEFNVIQTTSHGQDQTTSTNLNFLKKAMQVTEVFYQNRLKVSTIARIYAPATCVDFSPSSNDVSNGISSSDLHIYVRYVTDQTISYGATAKSCKYVSSLTLPDATLQQGRPTIGRIVYNTYSIIDDETSLTNRLFAEITATSLHETMHILGFDSSLYATFLDPDTGDVYNSGASPTTLNLLHANRAGNTSGNYILQTPFVTAWAQDFFDCNTLTGMALENEEDHTNPGSHWQRLSMYDELMTGTELGAQKGFSGLTFALLKDMGWYQVDDTFNDTSNYGYHLGCSFYSDACYGSTSYNKYFCDVSSYTNVSVCSTNFLGKAICTDTAAIYSDGCGIFGEYFHCVDPASSDDGYKSYTLETYSTGSFCVEATLSNVGVSSKYRSRCYPYQCFDTQIRFTIDTNTITCSDSEQGVQKTLSSLDGYLQCPRFEDFCETSRKICPNWCSQNGFCTRGICNCYTGYYGDDCSKTTCTSGQYYDQTTETCVSSCPSGTYENQYSRACLLCDTACDECRDQPTICTGCFSTPSNPQYFVSSSSTCVSQCPSNTYQDGDNCEDCDAASDCATCSYTATNCTSCLNDKFLEDPFFGSCITTCSGTYSLYDVANYKCVDTCTNNLVYYSTIPGQSYSGCDMCANGTYKFIDDQACHVNCPTKYYENQETRFCQNCDSSCQQCDGGYAQNCTKCSSSSSQKYLLLKMCVSSCPRGFYTNDSAGACQICSIDLNCATCELTNNTVTCLTCKYGYFLQDDPTCLTTCDTYKYQNKWNHSCDDCSTSCGQCTTPDSSSCTTCRASKYFLTNSSGGFCLDTCPTQKYVSSGTNCLDCYDTCLTCNGVSSSDCLTCQDGYYLSNGMCRYVCPSATYPETSTKTCNACDGSCTYCFGATIDNCTGCINGLVLNNFTCTDTCPENLTLNQYGVCFEKWNAFSIISFILLFYLLG